MLGTKGAAQGAKEDLACTASGRTVTIVSKAAAQTAPSALPIGLVRGLYMMGLL